MVLSSAMVTYSYDPTWCLISTNGVTLAIIDSTSKISLIVDSNEVLLKADTGMSGHKFAITLSIIQLISVDCALIA